MLKHLTVFLDLSDKKRCAPITLCPSMCEGKKDDTVRHKKVKKLKI